MWIKDINGKRVNLAFVIRLETANVIPGNPSSGYTIYATLVDGSVANLNYGLTIQNDAEDEIDKLLSGRL
jgi:hypothetical protein